MATINFKSIKTDKYKYFREKATSGILAFDLATNTGFAFSENGKRVFSGSINLKYHKKDDRPMVLSHGLYVYETLIRKMNPEQIIYEKPFHRGSGSTLLYGLAGILEAIAGKYKKPITDIHASSVRKTLLNNGATNKEDIQEYLRNLKIPFKTHDEADAISVLLSQFYSFS